MTDEFSDQIIDSFIEEMLTQQSPPDLSARIAAAWQREQQLVRATPIASPPSLQTLSQSAVIPSGGVAIGTSLSTTGRDSSLITIRNQRRKRRSVNFQRNLVAACLALGACGLLAFLGTRWIDQQDDTPLGSSPVTSGSTASVLATGEPRNSAIPAHPLSEPGEPQLATRPRSGSGENSSPGLPQLPAAEVRQSALTAGHTPLDIDNIPFALDGATGTTPGSGDGPTYDSKHSLTTVPPPLRDAEIVRGIDQRLSQLWRELKIVPTAELSPNDRVTTVVQRLIKEPQTNSTAKSDLPQLVQELTTSPQFAQYWGEKFVRAWMGRSPLSMEDPRIQLSEQYMASFITSQRPFNQIAIELLGGSLESTPNASTTEGQTASLSATFISAMAGNGNHRLVARIGSNLLDANVTCVRCHDSSLPESGSSSNTLSEFARQEVYWSLIALLQGIDVQSGAGQPRVAIDRQAKMLAEGKPLVAYYDMLDGRLQAVQPLLPNGLPWNSPTPDASALSGPRAALAHWISQSNALDEAIVNQVWRFVFGRPLVPQASWPHEAPLDQLAQRSRRELQLFLASQFRSHGHNLPRLVGWVVQSNALGRENVILNHAQWLDATDEELQRLQLTELNFAAGPLLPPTTEASSLEQSLAAVLKWKGDDLPSSTKASDTALAQPLPSLPASNSNRRRQAEKQTRATFPGISYALHGELPAPADAALVSRLLASQRLSWEQCVEHIVLLNASNNVNGRVRHLADELLRQRHGDARSALLDLLWAVRNSDSI